MRQATAIVRSMARSPKPDPFDENNDPPGRRVATGLAKIGLAIKNRGWHAAGELGLSPTQAQILAILYGRPEGSTGAADGGWRLSDVAEALAITAATASEAVSTLVGKKLIEKRRSSEDQRAVALVLSAAGRRAASELADWPDFLLAGVSALSDSEREVFLRGLVKMIATLQEQQLVPVSRMCVTCRYFEPYRHKSGERPHHCGFVGAAFGDRHLRFDCGDHEAAARDVAAASWRRYLAGE
jgi:DNA-binding MarR family transcriptional regulator